MATKVRINLANLLELLELPGLGPQQAEAIVRFRAEHGPIKDAQQLATVLDPLVYTLWQGPEDDERLVEEITRSLQRPAGQAPRGPPAQLEPVGGAVPLDSTFYIVRSTDEEFRAAIGRRDSIVLVKGARQVGKTSLLARGLQQARAGAPGHPGSGPRPATVALTHFQVFNAAQLETVDRFLGRQ